MTDPTLALKGREVAAVIAVTAAHVVAATVAHQVHATDFIRNHLIILP
jgi:hypothetical protein